MVLVETLRVVPARPRIGVRRGLDRHGRTLSYLLLGTITVDVPREAVPEGSPYIE